MLHFIVHITNAVLKVSNVFLKGAKRDAAALVRADPGLLSSSHSNSPLVSLLCVGYR